MIEPEVCSPSKHQSFSCYTKKNIRTMKHAFNKTRSKINKIVVDKTSSIWKELNSKLTMCKKESCWAKELRLNYENRFAPKSPSSWQSNPNEWLSSDDITAVLEQYENVYDDFQYLGPSPSDYFFKENGKCVWPELCNFNVNTSLKNRIGIVFNLDVHDGPGTHWVSLFINIKKKKIYYFDSTGEKIDEQNDNIMHLVDQIKAQDNRFTLIQNHPIEHQFGNTECGMYTLFFIITMLKTNNYKYFKTAHVFPDKEMKRLRKKYFNT
jgi:Ulp1 family protease